MKDGMVVRSTPRPERLLAKSTPPMGLRKHTAMVLVAAEGLLDARAMASLRAIGLPPDWEARLRRVVRLGAFVHDLGKCSDHFQRMLRGSNEPQLLRHEALSAWLARPEGPLGPWLVAAVDDPRELDVAAIAASGHHRKFPPSPREADPLTLLLSHADFASTCALGHKLGLPIPPVLADLVIERPARVLRAVDDWDERVGQELGRSWLRLLSVAKALVIAADVAGSALPTARSAQERKPQWILDQLDRRDDEAAARVVQTRLVGRALRPFQKRVQDCDAPVVLVQAGCGGGKTVAAYAWAARQHPGRRFWITYPTTGTTTEGYRGYVQDADVRGRLEHGRRTVDVRIFEIEERPDASRDDADDEVLRRSARGLDRLDALRTWGADVVTCTVDTVLGLLVDQRRGLYAWPSLCDAAVVFDEIHAYDERLFGLLLRFLRDLPGVPALLMTASLPRARKQALDEVVSAVHGRALPLIEGEADVEELPRYTLERRTAPPDEAVAHMLGCDRKVLWVCNTVGRALATAQRLAGFGPIVYHSRFRYIDRVDRHGEVVDAFARPGPALAVTTQVCEMSLDLSADLLVTDLAPVPALVQRLGRLNRRSHPDRPEEVKRCVVLPFSGLPYEQGLVEANAWIDRLGEGRPLGQRDLVRAWQADDPGGSSRPVEQAIWLDGGMATIPQPCRLASPGLTVLRQHDADDVASGRSPLAEMVLPMPPPPRRFAQQWRAWPRVLGVPVAPHEAIDYDDRRGGRWRDLEDR
jgi:CRISPR-associated endonuclease/helicase Cas3